ncbi:elongation factor G [Clostridium thermopalmarium]|uniref:Elongation factor G n=1 Tax=Clostridium thermopalmarium DSM 5974 TaxID=1121340 RepID=A0A2T0AYN4_9CLOT|nr:elongation factor G [Clostridium thermopalmarium]MBE6043383.1 elongation factor G [Clostridium thermopalmarium]PRR76116.1 Elongation factor G [Clostridium thermopalmarium DSM 5974]PVZ21431.1 translation elongation factor 2 (EF-2/EF-G) [Clostridium thermopalmarium DSM 5974]
MKDYNVQNLRNIAFIGHSGSGKTTLAEAMLYYTKTIDRFGKVEDGNTISDYDPEEKRRKISISTSVLPCEWENVKINIVDTPGYFDFIGEMIEGLRATDIAVIVVSARSGIKVGTEKAWSYVNENNMPRAFFINKLDTENSDFEKVLSQLKDSFGISVVPIQYPIGKENDFKGVINVISRKARIFNPKTNQMEAADIPEQLINKTDECKKMIMEAVAETDEVLLEEYLSEGALSDEEIYNGLIKGIESGEIAPVLCGSAYKGIGINTFLEDIVECFPSPKDLRPVKAKKDDKNIEVPIDENTPFSALVFKTIADPFVGKLSIFKVMSGKAKCDSIVYNVNKKKQEKITSMYFIRGKEQIPTSEIIAGDIGAVTKLQFTTTGDTLCEKEDCKVFEEIKFPKPVMSMAIVPKAKGDEEKISSGLNKLLDEDPTFKITRDVENADTIISGVGETHLEIIANKLKTKFGIDVELQSPKVPYRETIKKQSDVQGKHKKQSGGHGQYGDVKIKFEPRDDGEEDLLFVDKIVGGVVPKQYIPAVEKGLRECMKHGVLAGYPVIGLKATLYDGSYHPVDSSEMAFKVAASLAYKKGIQQANPVLLEPIMHVEVEVPDEYMGDIIGDINKKRGRVLGMEASKGLQKIIAEVPMAEMFKYATDLRSITGARGSFEMRFERYEEVPANEAEKIIQAANNKES